MDQFTFEEFARTIDGELLIVFRFCKTVWPHLVARGGGSIINVASTSAKVAYKVLPGIAHTAAKGGVLAMTRQLAMEGGSTTSALTRFRRVSLRPARRGSSSNFLSFSAP